MMQMESLIKTGADASFEWQPTEADLVNIRHLARLRYKISQIALIIEVRESEFRKRLVTPEDSVSRAYHAGKLESQLKYREAVQREAEHGEEWAVHVIERWDMEMSKEEHGFQQ